MVVYVPPLAATRCNADASTQGRALFSRHAGFAGLLGVVTARGVELRRPWSLADAIREAAAMKAEARRVRGDARAACEWANLAASDARRAVAEARRPWRTVVR